MKNDLTPPPAGPRRESAPEMTSEDARFSGALDILREGLGETYSAAVLHVRLGGQVVVEASIGTFAPGEPVIVGEGVTGFSEKTGLSDEEAQPLNITPLNSVPQTSKTNPDSFQNNFMGANPSEF